MGGIDHLITHYGPIAIFLGSGLEGHTVVIAGGVLAHQKLMSVWVCLACATGGSWLVDQALFLAGRRWRESRFVLKAVAAPGFGKALGFIERFPVSYTLAFRFLYGLRMVSPVAMGFSKISSVQFFVLNIIAAALWAGVFTGVGYLFGKTLGKWLGNFEWLERDAPWIVLGAVILFAGLYLLRRVVLRPKSPVDSTD